MGGFKRTGKKWLIIKLGSVFLLCGTGMEAQLCTFRALRGPSVSIIDEVGQDEPLTPIVVLTIPQVRPAHSS